MQARTNRPYSSSSMDLTDDNSLQFNHTTNNMIAPIRIILPDDLIVQQPDYHNLIKNPGSVTNRSVENEQTKSKLSTLLAVASMSTEQRERIIAASPRLNGSMNQPPPTAFVIEEEDPECPPERIKELVQMSWPNQEYIHRPPRDMKRLRQSEWYVVCKTLLWGENPALLMRSLSRSSDDAGMYKPPVRYSSFEFQVGDCIQVSEVKYSSSRNKIATDIRIKMTKLFPISLAKRLWTPPVIEVDSDNSTGGEVPSAEKKKKASQQKTKPPKKQLGNRVPAAQDVVPSRTQEKVYSILEDSSASSSGSSSIAQSPVNSIGIVSHSFPGDRDDIAFKLSSVLSMPWPEESGKKPPRDMKRLRVNEWYIVCKISKWGEAQALCLRGLTDPKCDYGFYKPPTSYSEYNFNVGDCIQIAQVGYSPLRNKVALDIRVRQYGPELFDTDLASSSPTSFDLSSSSSLRRSSDPEAAAEAVGTQTANKRAKMEATQTATGAPIGYQSESTETVVIE